MLSIVADAWAIEAPRDIFTPLVDILTVGGFGDHLGTVAAVSNIFAVKIVITLMTVDDIVASDMVIAHPSIGAAGIGAEKLLDLDLDGLNRLIAAEILSSDEGFIVFFGMGLVENVILFLVEIDTAKTVLAASTVGEKIRIWTVLRELWVEEVIAIDAVHALITKLAVLETKKVDTVTNILEGLAIVWVLSMRAIKTEIAVLEKSATIVVVSILMLSDDQA